MPYIGNSPGTGTRNRYIYTATASQTTFSGADDNGKTLAYSDGDYVDVFLNGICLVPVDDYTATSKTSIVLTVGAAADDILEVVAYDIATIADTVSKANGGTFEDNITISTNDNTTQLTLESTDTDASVGPVLDLYRNSSSPAADDLSGMIRFLGQDSAGNQQEYAKLRAQIKDPTSGSEDTQLSLQTFVGGSGRERMLITPTETNFNDDGVDLDFRIETDNNANMLFVDGEKDHIIIGDNAPYYPAAEGVAVHVRDAMMSGSWYSGKVKDSQNNTSGVVLLFDLDAASAGTIGLQFDGQFVTNSWTGRAYVDFSVVRQYSGGTIAWDIRDTTGALSSISKTNLKLVTGTYNSTSYLAVKKDGGGSGVSYINGFFEGSGSTIIIKEVAGSSFTTTTTHVTLI